jgi:hypothetical protein
VLRDDSRVAPAGEKWTCTRPRRPRAQQGGEAHTDTHPMRPASEESSSSVGQPRTLAVAVGHGGVCSPSGSGRGHRGWEMECTAVTFLVWSEDGGAGARFGPKGGREGSNGVMGAFSPLSGFVVQIVL